MYILVLAPVIAGCSAASAKFIRKHGMGLYALSYALFFACFYYAFSDIRYEMPEFAEGAAAVFERLFIKGTLPTAIFTVVMYAGALNPGWFFTKRLLQVRMELSIIGSVLISAHILIYLIGFIKHPIYEALELSLLLSAAAAFLLLIPLWATSYIKIRRRMSPILWKRVQKLAYPLYFLIFLHGAVIHALLTKSSADFCAYIFVFGVYLALKLKKQEKKK